MNTWFIGDLHFSHQKIIEYTNRPFTSAEEMDQKLIDNWNRIISRNDSVYVLGDFALGGRTRVEEILKQLKGKDKYLLRGNHDHWASNPNCSKYFTWIKDYYELRENGRLWVLCHYPFYSWNRRYSGSIHLHGHTHRDINLSTDMDKPLHEINPEICNRYMCVSCECTGYKPISLEEVRAKLKV